MSETVGELVRLAGGSGAAAVRAAARLMTLVENEPRRLPELFQEVREGAAARGDAEVRTALARLMPRLVVGITGAPGSGKSTLTDALVTEYRRRNPERRLGVIAVDPSSPFTGGAVLGDRVRMMRHATDPMVFVRSMASRGHVGGLSLGAKGVLRVMGLIGCDLVFLETVGVGQSEIEVVTVADVVMVVLAPAQGDSVQLLKAGLMEIGDLFVVNKADRPDAAQLHAQLLSVLQLASAADTDGHHAPAARRDRWRGGEPVAPPANGSSAGASADAGPAACLVSATNHDGIGDLVDQLEKTAVRLHARLSERRGRAIENEVLEAVYDEARRRVEAALGPRGLREDLVADVIEGRVSVERLTDRLLGDATGRPGRD